MVTMSTRRIVALLGISLFFTFAGVSMVIEGRQGGWPVFLIFLCFAVVFITSHFAARSQSEKPLSIIEAYPKPVTLNGQRGRNLLSALACCGVSSAFIFALLSSPPLTGSVVLYFVLSVIFGVPAFVLATAAIKPNRLTLDSKGLVFSSLFHTRQWIWQDVQDFKAISTATQGKRVTKIKETIGFNDRNARNSDRLRKQIGRTTSISNQFGISDDELASALNSWRLRSVTD